MILFFSYFKKTSKIKTIKLLFLRINKRMLYKSYPNFQQFFEQNNYILL